MLNSYLVALAIGVLVGGIYGAFQVKSPAPPVVALIGLLGILIGETGFSYVKTKLSGGTTIEVRSEQSSDKGN